MTKTNKKWIILILVVAILLMNQGKKEAIIGGYISPEQCLDNLYNYYLYTGPINTPCHYATQQTSTNCGETMGYWYFSGYPYSGCDTTCQQQRDCLYDSGINSCPSVPACYYVQYYCSDGKDNDGNGCADYGADTGCSSATDFTEEGGTCTAINYNGFLSSKNTFLSGGPFSDFITNANVWVGAPPPVVLITSQEVMDDNAPFWGVNWEAQTFTSSQAFTLSYIKLNLYKGGVPTGPIIVSIRATSGGSPIGSDLSTGTIEASTISDGWNQITMSSITLNAGTTYAIIIRFPSGTSTTNIVLRRTKQDIYPDNRFTSSDSGASWILRYSDAAFAIWGVTS